MGFGTIVSQVIMFITIVSIGSGLIIFFSGYMKVASDTLDDEKQDMLDSIRTDITITSATLDRAQTPDLTTINLENTGKRFIKNISKIDIYIDNIRIKSGSKNAAFTLSVTNPGIWDPDERIQINVSKDLATGNHKVRVYVTEETYDEKIIS
jgi:archaellum component FlaF (FlaF/FlaG flagellin family)